MFRDGILMASAGCVACCGLMQIDCGCRVGMCATGGAK